MTIHHATTKRADDAGIALVEHEGGTVSATFGDQTLSHPKAKTALDAAILAKTLAAEYSAVGLRNTPEGDDEAVEHVGWLELFRTSDDEAFERFGDVPDLATVLDAAIDAGVDPEEGAEEDAGPVVVVAPLYKRRYAEGGHPEHCGDWIAYQLEGAFLADPAKPGGEPVFDTDAFASCLLQNGVELVGKWAALPTSGQPGWQGRYRMNGRQKLEQRVAATGVLQLHGVAIDVPEADLQRLREKHPKVVVAETTEAE